MIKLHYAELDNMGDIPFKEFESFEAMKWYLEDEFCSINCSKRVYLFTWGCENEDIFISEFSDMPFKALSGFYIDEVMKIKDFHLHEYYSFEDAYQVAIDMKEGNKLCYDLRPELN